MGRPSKCTPELTELVADNLSIGMTTVDACRAAGLGQSTFTEWMAKAREGDERFAAFAAACTRARSDGVRSHLLNIKKAGISDWRASAHILAILNPEDYAVGRQRQEKAAREHVAKDERFDDVPTEVCEAAERAALAIIDAWRDRQQSVEART